MTSAKAMAGKFIRLKTINSHTGLARFLAECEGDEESAKPVGYVARPTDIPSPYHYSQTVAVYLWNGFRVIWRETRHKHYEVFSIPADAQLTTAD